MAKNTMSMSDMAAQYKKSYGETVGGIGIKPTNVPRIPTGFFAFDLASGGGVPRNSVTEVFGPESSGKTNMCLRLIAQHQRMWPDKKCVFFDIEGTLDPKWAKTLGVDVDKLYYFQPSYAEQVVDMVEGILHTDDCGLVVVDSLAAMASGQELNSSAEKAVVGGAALAIGKLARRSALALNQARQKGNNPTLICINQIRFKIGVMFGDPETTPGGMAPKHAFTMRVRLYGKNVMDPKISNVMPVRKKMSFIIRKWKVPIYNVSGDFEAAMLPHSGLLPGQTNDWPTLDKCLRMYGLLEKNDKGVWVMCGSTYPTLTACRERLAADIAYADEIKNALIAKAIEEAQADPTKNSNEGELSDDDESTAP